MSTAASARCCRRLSCAKALQRMLLLPLLLVWPLAGVAGHAVAAPSANMGSLVQQDSGRGVVAHREVSNKAVALPPDEDHLSLGPALSAKSHLMRKADSVPAGSPDDEYESDSVPVVRNDAVVGLFRQYHQIKAHTGNLTNPFDVLNQTISQLVNATQKQIENVTSMNMKSEVLKAMRVRLNGKEDTNALLASLIFSSVSGMVSVAAFYFLRPQYPCLYSDRGPSEHTVETIPVDAVIKDAGLDAWMLMSFHNLAMKITGMMFLMVLFFCPYHWSIHDPKEHSDLMARLSLTGLEEDSGILWFHAGGMYFVVIVTVHFMIRAKGEFTKLRYDWLQRMPAPRATTLLIEGIPEQVCNDQALSLYFKNTFTEQAIVRASVVRKTHLLEAKLAHLEELKLYAQTHHAAQPSEGNLQSVQIEELAVEAERARLTVAKHTFDPEVCSDCGFVTFATRIDARRALHEQFGDDNHQFRLREAPDPEDVVFKSLAENPSLFSWLAGWFAIIILFTAWAPLVLFVTGVMSLDSLQVAFPSLAPYRMQNPCVNAVVDGILATLALSWLMAVLPTIFLLINQRFFRPVSAVRSRLFVEKLYFTFQLVFVLLVTTIGQGFFTTLFYLAESPIGIFPLLARSLPAASHFYSAYIVMGWCSCTFELCRASTLSQYLGLQAIMDEEKAYIYTEKMYDMTGHRYGKAALMLSVVLVFSSLSPLISIFGFIYFATCRVVHGYLVCFAEPQRTDLGGEFWVAALKQLHIALIVYVMLMLGVLSSHGAGPLMLAAPTLLIVIIALYNFDRRYVWKTLPLQAVALADTLAASGELGDAEADQSAYMQPECSEEVVTNGLRRLSAAAARLSLHHIAAGDGLPSQMSMDDHQVSRASGSSGSAAATAAKPS